MRIQILTLIMAVILLLSVFQLIRKKKLLEKYSLLWIASCILLIIVALWKGLLDRLSGLFGIYYPPSALFMTAILCGIVISLHFSVVISRLREQNNTLAQEIALLKQEVEALGNKTSHQGKKAN